MRVRTIPPTSHPDPALADDVRDEGSILPMILALMVVGSLAVVSLLTFATTLFTNRPPIEVRDRTFWSAKSALAQAMTLQREFGAAGCYRGTDSIQLNGFTAEITCGTLFRYGSARGRMGVVTTGNDPAVNQLAGNGPTAAVKPITGNVFINGGRLDATTADIAPTGTVFTSAFASALTSANRYVDFTTPVSPAPALAVECSDANVKTQMQFPDESPTGWNYNGCVPDSWQTLVGDQDTVGGPHSYPELPPLPTYLRPSAPQAILGSCNVYYPGRYGQPLTLAAGDHYFPSGIYYFENVLTLEAGARVVAGDGRYAGCTFDAEAGFASSAPKFHEITGKGATFLLGGSARIVSNDASLRINRRVSTPNTRGTETVAIRSVNFRPTGTPAPTTPQPPEIPDDFIYVADVFDAANTACDPSLGTALCLQRAVDHQLQATTGDVIYRYLPSTLAPTANIIEINQTGGDRASNQFVSDGYVFVPNARIQLTGGANADYRVRLAGGVVASALKLGYDRMPTNADDWYLGVIDEPIQAKVEMVAVVTAPNGQQTVSKAILEVNVDRSYAINGWTVDPNASGPVALPTPDPNPVDPIPTTTTTVPAVTTTTTTVPESTTTTVPETTTTLPPAPTTTLPPVIPSVPSNGTGNCDDVSSTPGGWTTDFGGGTWAAEYWNWGGGSRPNFNSNDPFNGAPTQTGTRPSLALCGNTVPHPGVQGDSFSARFTKTWTLTAPKEVTFLAGGDDGYRVFVNGTRIVNNWEDHAHEWSTHTMTLPAGNHTIVFEFYEIGGQNSWQFWRN